MRIIRIIMKYNATVPRSEHMTTSTEPAMVTWCLGAIREPLPRIFHISHREQRTRAYSDVSSAA